MAAGAAAVGEDGRAEALAQVGDLAADAVGAAEDDDGASLDARPVLRRVERCGRRVAGELEEPVDDDHVDGVGHFHVLLRAGDHVDRHLGQVLEDDAAVVARAEVRVGDSVLVGPPDRREQEALRRLAAAHAGPGRDVGDEVSAVHLDDRVGRRDRDVDGLVGVERLDAVRDDPPVDEGPHGVVEEHLALLVTEDVEGCAGRVVAGGAAGDHPGHLAHPRREPARVVEVRLGGGEDDLVDLRRLLEDAQGVLEDRRARDLDELLGDAQPDTGARAAAEYDTHRAQSTSRRFAHLQNSPLQGPRTARASTSWPHGAPDSTGLPTTEGGRRPASRAGRRAP